MRKRLIPAWAALLMAAGALAAAVSAPAEVIDNLEFFSDMEMLANLDLMEEDMPEVAVSSAPVAVSTTAFSMRLSTAAVVVSTQTRRLYEKH